MGKNEEINEVIEIPVAERRFVDEKNLKFKRKIIFLSPFLIFFFSFMGLLFKNNFEIKNFTIGKSDSRILGHLPYEETSKEELVFIEPHIWVHKDMSQSLLRMRRDAKMEGVNLVFLSGFRSIKLQDEIFYSLKSIRNQNALERARVSAPPGYSEHSTGFAIDIGDANYRETDFEIEFENTEAFRWLKMNAARYHFKLSFTKNNKYIDYEPWHWRYEGSIDALKVFENANREFLNVSN